MGGASSLDANQPRLEREVMLWNRQGGGERVVDLMEPELLFGAMTLCLEFKKKKKVSSHVGEHLRRVWTLK